MFCVLYELKIKPGFEQKFLVAWHSVTQSVITTNGSLGARLHKADYGPYIAYAVWPDRVTWEAGHHAIEAEALRMHLGAWLDEVPTVLMKLDVIDDLLVQTIGM